MIITPTFDNEVIKNIMLEPEIAKLVFTDEEIKNFIVDHSWQYLLIKNHNKITGMYQVKGLTKTVLEMHPFVVMENKGENHQEKLDALHSWAKKRKYLKIFTTIPSNAIHALKAAQKHGYTSCGMIEKGIVYHGLLATLFFFEFDLYKR